MEKGTHTNRYGDIHTFTSTGDGNILWEGNFSYSRFGWANDYTAAYTAYLEQGGNMPLNEFRKKVHEWDDKKKEYVMGRELISLVKSDTSKLDMVDPSGGPYICTGMEFEGKIIVDIKSRPEGYLLILEDLISKL
jgi:hypothetical protein